MNDLISRQQVIDALHEHFADGFSEDRWWNSTHVLTAIKNMPSADLPKEYAKSVWLWMLNYQIKAAELQGRYTPYEVLSWVANDWRKENGLDKQTGGN